MRQVLGPEALLSAADAAPKFVVELGAPGVSWCVVDGQLLVVCDGSGASSGLIEMVGANGGSKGCHVADGLPVLQPVWLRMRYSVLLVGLC